MFDQEKNFDIEKNNFINKEDKICIICFELIKEDNKSNCNSPSPSICCYDKKCINCDKDKIKFKYCLKQNCEKCKKITLKCFHTFCKSCITEWLKIKSNCPICRANITYEDFEILTKKSTNNTCFNNNKIYPEICYNKVKSCKIACCSVFYNKINYCKIQISNCCSSFYNKYKLCIKSKITEIIIKFMLLTLLGQIQILLFIFISYLFNSNLNEFKKQIIYDLYQNYLFIIISFIIAPFIGIFSIIFVWQKCQNFWCSSFDRNY